MTTRRPADFELSTAITAPGFTAREADLPALVALLASDDETLAAHAERALADLAPRLGARLPKALDEALARATRPLRGRLAKLVGRLAVAESGNDRPFTGRVLALVDDPDPKASRNAVIALGKIPSPEAERRLLAVLAAPRDAAQRRSAALALGKIGGRAALAALRAQPPDPADAELARLVAQAVLRLERTLARDVASTIDLAATLDADAPLVLTCRRGLEGMLVEELGARFEARIAGPGLVTAILPRGEPLAALYRARLFIDLAFDVPLAARPTPETIARALAATTVLRRLTRGAIRYRVSFAGAGHRRAEVLRVATAVAARAPELINDPTATTWELEIPPPGARAPLRLWPRRLDDPRFTWRRRDVPAASHPTVAAALARAGGVRRDDVVWDPFVGSGGELVERALLGPYAALHGCDLDPAALAAAAENLAAAGHRASLRQRDARLGPPPGTTLVLSNPPMGQRVSSRAAVEPLLLDLVDVVAPALPKGGRMAWLSPIPDQTADRAARAGLTVRLRQPVDLGGIPAELQLYVK